MSARWPTSTPSDQCNMVYAEQTRQYFGKVRPVKWYVVNKKAFSKLLGIAE